MKIKKISAFIIFFFVLAGGCDEPRAQFAGITHDFGLTGQNRELRHIFRFSNTGGSPLIIQKIHAG